VCTAGGVESELLPAANVRRSRDHRRTRSRPARTGNCHRACLCACLCAHQPAHHQTLSVLQSWLFTAVLLTLQNFIYVYHFLVPKSLLFYSKTQLVFSFLRLYLGVALRFTLHTGSECVCALCLHLTQRFGFACVICLLQSVR
jgi:hypothetical protein